MSLWTDTFSFFLIREPWMASEVHSLLGAGSAAFRSPHSTRTSTRTRTRTDLRRGMKAAREACRLRIGVPPGVITSQTITPGGIQHFTRDQGNTSSSTKAHSSLDGDLNHFFSLQDLHHPQWPPTPSQSPYRNMKVLSIEQLAQQHPLLDMVDHQRKPTPPSSPAQSLPQIQAIILFGEPIKWETNLQLLIDVLLTNGRPGNVHDTQLLNQLPILACNMDLLWMAEAPSPRFGHGMFLLCLESVYRKLTGRELHYEALLGKPSLLTYQYAEQLLRLQNHNRKLTTVYAVGDNLMTDIYGANLYNRYLAQQHIAMTTAAKLVAQGTGSQVTMAEEVVVCAAQCHSILVCTGVYDPRSLLPGDQNSGVSETVFHGHRDLALELDLVEPSHVVKDVEAAVDLLLQQESSVTSDL